MKRVKTKLVLALFIIFYLFFTTTSFAQNTSSNKSTYQLNAKSKILSVGESFNLKVISKSQNANNLKLVFTSSNNSVANVDRNGRIKAIGVGYADIIVTIKEKNVRLICKIQVKSIEVQKISLNTKEVNIKIGETFNLSAEIYPNNAINKDLIWTNSNPEVVEVDSGKVTAKKSGNAVVTVYSQGKKVYDRCLINVIDEEMENFLKLPMEKQAEYVIKNYCKDGYNILQSVSSKNNQEISNLIKQWNGFDLFQTIDTAVHEECHEYQFIMNQNQYDWNNRYWTINHTYILDGQQVVVKFVPNKLFKTEDALGNLSDDLKTMRWKLYVSKGSIYASNVYGIYGLLQEYEAYYYGNKSVYDAFDFAVKMPFARENFINYYLSIEGTAFYEFTYYILSYLKFSKEHRPDVYNIIMNDNNFKTVFKYVYNNYKTLIEDLKLKRGKEIKELLKDKGYNVEFDMSSISISNGNDSYPSSSGSDVTNLKKELEKEEYKMILKELIE